MDATARLLTSDRAVARAHQLHDLSCSWLKYYGYRVDDYRVLCRIEDEKLVVLVVRLGHRRDIYE